MKKEIDVKIVEDKSTDTSNDVSTKGKEIEDAQDNVFEVKNSLLFAIGIFVSIFAVTIAYGAYRLTLFGAGVMVRLINLVFYIIYQGSIMFGVSVVAMLVILTIYIIYKSSME